MNESLRPNGANVKLAFQKFIIIILSIQLGVPSSLYAKELNVAVQSLPTAEQMPAVAVAQEAGKQLPPPTRAEEKLRRAQLKEARNQSLNLFKTSTKMADSVITTVKTFTEYMTHTGEVFPVSGQFGEFGHTMTEEERVNVGRQIQEELRSKTKRNPTDKELEIMNKMSPADAKLWFARRMSVENPAVLFFTLKSRMQEALAYKVKYEADENKGKDPSKYTSVVIVPIPDYYEDLLMKDAGLKSKKVSDYIQLPTNPFSEKSRPNLPMFSIIKNGLTASIDKKDSRSALKWGVITAGVYSAVFFTNAYQSGNHAWQLPAAMITYAAITSWFYTGQADRIRNVFQADITRDFRVVGAVRQGIEQLPLSFGFGFLAFSLGSWVSPVDFTQTFEQVLGNTALSLAGIAVGIARMKNLSRTASRQFLNYNNWVSIVLNSLMISGVVGITHNLTYMEVTTASLVKAGLALSLVLGLYVKKDKFEKVLSEIARKKEEAKREEAERLEKKIAEKEERNKKADELKRARNAAREQRRLQEVEVVKNLAESRYADRVINFSSIPTESLSTYSSFNGKQRIEPRLAPLARTCQQLFGK